MASRRSDAILMAEGGFEITLRDVYLRVTDISAQLGQLSSNMQRTEDKIEEGAKQRTDHEIRLRSLERFKYQLLGAIVIINVFLVIIENYFLKK